MIYRILADGIDIYGSEAESTLISPSLETELNAAGSCEFTLPPDHPSYNDIVLLKTEIEVYEDGELIFFGRPSEISIDWFKQKKVTCEGALAYLNDAAIRPHTFEGALISDVFRHIIGQYNSQVEQNKRFIIGNITILDRYVYTELDYDNCLSALQSTCVDSTEGYIFLRKEDDNIYIDWLKDVPDVSDQPVQFASNLLDLTQDLNAEDICTVVLPLGGQVDGEQITIASVNSGSDILESSTGIDLYGRVLKVQNFSDIIDPQSLKDRAQEWLDKEQYDKLCIEANAAELHYLDGSVGSYKIGQMVNVISNPHLIDKEVPILKLSLSMDSGVKKVTMGTPPRRDLTELSGITSSSGGSSSSGGGGGGTGGDGVTDVLVNGSSVVSGHVARVSVPTNVVTESQMNTAIGNAVSNRPTTTEMNTAISSATSGLPTTTEMNTAISEAVANKVTNTQLNQAMALKQDKLTPGTNITIDENNVISATGGGTEVEANPSEEATDELETIKIGDTVYDIPGSGGGGGTVMMSDYYSEEEQVVGRWTDGKPIYQKSYHYNNTSSQTVYVDVSSLNIDRLVLSDLSTGMGTPQNQVAGNWYMSNSDYGNCYYNTISNNIEIRRGSEWTKTANGVMTIQYTKTTDAPGTGPTKGNLIYLPALYSEEEREVGVWTDGKPLYQKTYIWTNTELNQWVNHDVSDINIDTMVDIKGWFKRIANGQVILIHPIGYEERTNNAYSAQCRYTATNNTIDVYNALPSGNSSDQQVITIQYTKTTDQPGSGTWTPEGQLVHHYSTSEKIVGTWIDGSTVYERTWDLGTPELEFTEDTWVNTTISNANMSAIVNVLARSNNGTYWGFMCANCDTGSYVQLYHSRPGNKTVKVRYLTLQYTKTT